MLRALALYTVATVAMLFHPHRCAVCASGGAQLMAKHIRNQYQYQQHAFTVSMLIPYGMAFHGASASSLVASRVLYLSMPESTAPTGGATLAGEPVTRQRYSSEAPAAFATTGSRRSLTSSLFNSLSPSSQTEQRQQEEVPRSSGNYGGKHEPSPIYPLPSPQLQSQPPKEITSINIDDKPASAQPASTLVVIASPTGSTTATQGKGSDDLERCRLLANSLGVALVVAEGEGEDSESRERKRVTERKKGSPRFTLLFDDEGRLALGQPGSGFKPLVVDFLGGKTGHRTKHQQGMEQVVKAAALPKRCTTATMSAKEEGDGDDKEAPLLWDLTAGLGTDAFVLASAGWRVEMFERSPVVAALVQDALDRARAFGDESTSEAASRMSLTVADSTSDVVVAARTSGEASSATARRRPDVVYLDPMFPQRKKKSALVKKGMQMLQALLKEDESVGRGTPHDGSSRAEGGRDETRAEEERRLFEVAMHLATRKVVVKRPVHGASIVQHMAPSHAVVSKNGRFDVYAVP